MTLNVFVTGATGYIGGDALVEIVQAHPDWKIACLVRSKEKGEKITAAFPQVRIVLGDLDSQDLIADEASKADIVYNFANCDHKASAQAIAAGLARRTSATPGFWIHVSGTGILTWETRRNKSFGENNPKVYDDWENVGELTSLPDDAAHRDVDKIVLAASALNPDKIKTAIVAPPTIYGFGRGPDNRRSVQVPLATNTFLKHKTAFSVGKGENVWHEIHVHDLSKLFLLLGEAAANGGSPATWDDKGYYLAENGAFVWGDVFRAIAHEAHKQGLIPSAEVGTKPFEETLQYSPKYPYMVGSTSRGVSKRGKLLLGWNPNAISLLEHIPEIIQSEAKALGL